MTKHIIILITLLLSSHAHSVNIVTLLKKAALDPTFGSYNPLHKVSGNGSKILAKKTIIDPSEVSDAAVLKKKAIFSDDMQETAADWNCDLAERLFASRNRNREERKSSTSIQYRSFDVPVHPEIHRMAQNYKHASQCFGDPQIYRSLQSKIK